MMKKRVTIKKKRVTKRAKAKKCCQCVDVCRFGFNKADSDGTPFWTDADLWDFVRQGDAARHELGRRAARAPKPKRKPKP